MGIFLNKEALEELNGWLKLTIPDNLDLDGVVKFIIKSGKYKYSTPKEKKSRIIQEISELLSISEDFIRDNKDTLLWYEISVCSTLSESFMNEFSEYLIGCWNNVLCNQTYSDEFFVKNYGKVIFEDEMDKDYFWWWIITEGKISTSLISHYNNLGEIPQRSWERVYE
jgi:hypothetical protein